MTLRILVVAVVAVIAGSSAVPASPPAQAAWQLYMPEKERKPVWKRAYRRGTMKMNFAAGTFVDVVWVTKDVARAVVSEQVDQERLSPAEAERQFAGLRDRDHYAVIVRFSALPGGPEFKERSLFLQRASQTDVFTRGRLVEGASPGTPFRVTNRDSTLLVVFPKRTESGEPVVRNTAERLEISLLAQYPKPVVIPVAVSEIVSDPGDL